MSNIVALFDSVLNSHLQLFSPTVDQYFNEFDIQILSKKYSNEEFDSLLENVFILFPRSDKNYNQIIEKLASFASTNSTFIIGHLCSKLNNEISRKADSLPTIQIYSFLTYRGTNFYHFMFIHYLILIFLSDLLLKIVSKCHSTQSSSNIIKFGFGLCVQTQRLKFLQDLLIDTWSYIFYYISLDNLKCIIENFNTKFDQESPNKVIKLIRRIFGNQSIADLILQSFIVVKKKKNLTSELLFDLSFLLARINCNVETLSEFYKLIWELKGVDELKFGAIMMITVLFNRIPTQSKNIIQFYQTRVYKHAQNDKKVERSLRAFLHLIRGNISKIQGPGDDTNPLSYISTTRPLSVSSQISSSPPSSTLQKQKPQNNPETYIITFMKVFFPKSNFSICPNLFRDILIHLASIDINEFTAFLLPKFLSLNQNDPRFIVMLMVIPFLNQSNFIKNSYCHATKQQILLINQNVQQVLFTMIPVLQSAAKEQKKAIEFDSVQIHSIIDESDHLVGDFLQRNNFTLFDYNHDDRKLNKKRFLIKPNDLSIVLNILNCIQITFTNENFMKNPELINIIIELSCSEDHLTSSTASNICTNIFNNRDIQPFFIKEATNLIINSCSFEVRSKSIQFLSYSLQHLSYEMPSKENYIYELKAASLIGLMSNSPYCRALAFNLFKRIDSFDQNSEIILHHLVELNDPIIEKVKNFMMILNNSEKPYVILPLIGRISFETACYCKYNEFWIINYAEILNIIIDLKCEKILGILNKSLQNRFNSIRKNAKQKSKKDNKKEIKNKNKKAKENEKEETDLSLVSFFLCFIDTFASGKEFNNKNTDESAWYIEKVDSICKKILKIHSTRLKRSFIKSFRFLNWRVIPTVLHSMINVDTKLYSYISEALSLIIQNTTNTNKIFSQIFHILIPYLNSFQTYFKDIQINGMSEIKWNEPLLKKLKKNEKFCINYCILISVAFKKKIQNNISEDEWPLSYRQVHVKYLSNWGQISCNESEFNFDKLKAYAVDALVLVLKSGTIFTNEFEFDLSMLDMLSQCQLSDFSVLDSLLFYHSDILLGEFIKQVLLKTQRESLIFLNSIIRFLKKLDDSADIQQWGGALSLLAIFCNEQMNDSNDDDDAWKFILEKIAILLLKEKNGSDTVQMINKAENASFVLTVFQFLTEQFIQFSFDVIKASQRAVVVKMIVNFLNPWIEKLRILPTQGFIIPGIPTKFRIYSVLTFFNEILSLSQNLNDEQLDVFSQIWYNLLKSSDNNVIVLLLLFEYEKNDIKMKIFEKLLDKDPRMITKFLVERCSFAFWYSIKTQRKINQNYQSWMMKVLSRSFINYKKEVTKKFVYAFHYSLLFIEKAGELFNALIEFLELDPINPSFVWKTDADFDDTIGVTTIISKSINKIKKTNPRAIEKWSLEATRWSVACNDLRIAHRSLVILNCLENPLDTSFTRLLLNSVLYFLNHSSLLAQLNYLSTIGTTATDQEQEQEVDLNINSESSRNEKENEIENVTFNLNLDEIHQFSSSYSSQSFPKTEDQDKLNDVFDSESQNSNVSSSISIHVSSSEIDSNSENDEISCYFSHNETLSEENIVPSLDEVSYYVSESLKLLYRHFEEKEIGEFAFKFANCFIHFRPFLRNCLINSLPIFMRYFYSISQEIDTDVIIDAFIPFSRTLETRAKSQEIFIELITRTKIRELYIIASVFLQKKEKFTEIQFLLPSIDIGMSYEEIMKIEYTKKEVQNSFTIFSEMLNNCSKNLCNSIFYVSNELLVKYGKMIDKTLVVPVYNSAISLIGVFETANEFVESVSQIAPSIISLKYNEWPPNSTSIEDLKSSISSIIKDMNMKILIDKIGKNKKVKERSNSRACSLIPTNFLPSPRNLRSNSVVKNLNNNSNNNEPITLSSTARSPISSSKIVFKPASPKLPLTRSSSKSSFSRFSAGDASNFIDNSTDDDDDNLDEIVPITKCKDIQHLFGMIDQKHPPKIIPFASHYEMIIGLTKEVKKKMKMKEKAEKMFSKRKYTSSLSISSQMMSNKSFSIDLSFQTKGIGNLNLSKLKKIEVNQSKLDLPYEKEDNNRNKFIGAFEDFLKLSDENLYDLPKSSMISKKKKKKKNQNEL